MRKDVRKILKRKDSDAGEKVMGIYHFAKCVKDFESSTVRPRGKRDSKSALMMPISFESRLVSG
ncbi:hypothetical protein HAX54_045991, partial [Datura stramonium]|nr:hypothetical protein [Datura stramonium]